ncbi:CLUMA_CG008499, isoform A [Clunio marinus]|uniref:CLUMA_CG008499, isoform A n=1 Tax=Clunio marinus TaxID=568069 RepID=A0A1J1I3Z3_9DIPT|nr:CLUMA_CG008499, isoform A [Clunio marinus]
MDKRDKAMGADEAKNNDANIKKNVPGTGGIKFTTSAPSGTRNEKKRANTEKDEGDKKMARYSDSSIQSHFLKEAKTELSKSEIKQNCWQLCRRDVASNYVNYIDRRNHAVDFYFESDVVTLNAAVSDKPLIFKKRCEMSRYCNHEISPFVLSKESLLPIHKLDLVPAKEVCASVVPYDCVGTISMNIASDLTIYSIEGILLLGALLFHQLEDYERNGQKAQLIPLPDNMIEYLDLTPENCAKINGYFGTNRLILISDYLTDNTLMAIRLICSGMPRFNLQEGEPRHICSQIKADGTPITVVYRQHPAPSVIPEAKLETANWLLQGIKIIACWMGQNGSVVPAFTRAATIVNGRHVRGQKANPDYVSIAPRDEDSHDIKNQYLDAYDWETVTLERGSTQIYRYAASNFWHILCNSSLIVPVKNILPEEWNALMSMVVFLKIPIFRE